MDSLTNSAAKPSCRIVSSLMNIMTNIEGTLDKISSNHSKEQDLLDEKLADRWSTKMKLLELLVLKERGRREKDLQDRVGRTPARLD